MSREEPRQHPMIKGAVGEDFPIALYRGGHRADLDFEVSESPSLPVVAGAVSPLAPPPSSPEPQSLRETFVERVNSMQRRLDADSILQRPDNAFTHQFQIIMEEAKAAIDSTDWETADQNLQAVGTLLERWRKHRNGWIAQLEQLDSLRSGLEADPKLLDSSEFLRQSYRKLNSIVQTLPDEDSPGIVAEIVDRLARRLGQYHMLANELYTERESLAGRKDMDAAHTRWHIQLSGLIRRLESLPPLAESEDDFAEIGRLYERERYALLEPADAMAPEREESRLEPTFRPAFARPEPEESASERIVRPEPGPVLKRPEPEESALETVVVPAGLERTSRLGSVTVIPEPFNESNIVDLDRRANRASGQLQEDDRLRELGEPFAHLISNYLDHYASSRGKDWATSERYMIAAETLLAKWRRERLEWIEQLEYLADIPSTLQAGLPSDFKSLSASVLGEIVSRAPEYDSAKDFQRSWQHLRENIAKSGYLFDQIKELQSLTNDVLQDESTRSKLQKQLADVVWQLQYMVYETEPPSPDSLENLEHRIRAFYQRLRHLINAQPYAPEVSTPQPGEPSPDTGSLTKSVDETTEPIFTPDSATAVLEPAPITPDAPAEDRVETSVDTRTTEESHTPEQRTPAPDAPSTPTPAGDSVAPELVPASAGTHPVGASVTTNVLVGTPLPTPPRDEDRLTIDIDDNTVTLRWSSDENQPYVSPNRLNYQELANPDYSVRDIGRLLFEGIIHDKGREPDFKHRPTAMGYLLAREQAKQGLRIGLRIAPNAQAYTLPWESLWNQKDDAPLSVDEHCTFYRLHSTTDKPAAQATPIRVLFAMCSPKTLSPDSRDPNLRSLEPLSVQLERRIIQQAMEPLEQSGLAVYDILGDDDTPVTFDLLKTQLRNNWHVLHLLAHGGHFKLRGAPASQYVLVFENENREHAYIAAEAFDTAMFNYDLRLVVLAACQSGNLNQDRVHEKGETFRALAPVLVEKGVPAVIAMQQDIPLTAAQLFTQRFYGDLARSGRIDMALAATRHDLWSLDRQSATWAIPMLLMGQHEARLFHVDEAHARNVPRPAANELRIRDHKELGGSGDPEAVRLAQALEKQVYDHGFGANSGLLNALRGVIAPSLLRRAPDPEPLVPRQDRKGLAAQLARQVDIDAQALKDYVLHHSGVEVSEMTYAQIASALNAGKHLILLGPPGTGKTSLAQDICAFATRQDLPIDPLGPYTPGGLLATATADWTTFDTVGGYVPTPDQTLQFRPGMFLRAVCTGHWLIIDEINRADIDKAFGELFTVLSGQSVTLPYMVGNEVFRVLPAGWWSPSDPRLGRYDYVVHPCWRIIGTMNVYDKSSLYTMSFAFMRRFAFIDTDLPDNKTVYFRLVDKWLQEGKLPATLPASDVEGVQFEHLQMLQQKFRQLLDRTCVLMQRRALGPAIVKDMIRYMSDRYRREQDESKLLGEAFLLYVTPQLDALDYKDILQIYAWTAHFFMEVLNDVGATILMRLRLLYPHIPEVEWEEERRKVQEMSAHSTGE